MNYLARVASFRDLVVYQKARTLQHEIFEISKSFPREETFSLTDQIRRSSCAIGANIAEAWAKRRYEKHFIKLTDADSEQMETPGCVQSRLTKPRLRLSLRGAVFATKQSPIAVWRLLRRCAARNDRGLTLHKP